MLAENNFARLALIVFSISEEHLIAINGSANLQLHFEWTATQFDFITRRRER